MNEPMRTPQKIYSTLTRADYTLLLVGLRNKEYTYQAMSLDLRERLWKAPVTIKTFEEQLTSGYITYPEEADDY